jgi:hypothetical protein
MRQPQGTLWTERALVLLVVASLAGTVNLVITVHRREAAKRALSESISSVSPRPAPPVEPAPLVADIAPIPPRILPPGSPKPPAPPAEDPTNKALAELSTATSHELEEARKADRRADSLEQARQTAVAESQRWRRREMLVKQQLTALAQKAHKIDREIDVLAAERDVLARERDSLKAALAKDPQNGSYAVLPYKGQNGTWRRPIVLECTNGTVTLRPKGPTFSMLDLSAMINPRSSPVVLAIARELLRVQMSESPDGAPVVPYFVFLVRPDGIRPYYEARARLEPLGIAFGYELIEQDLKVDVPDFDNLAAWDGTIPLEEPLMSAPGAPDAEAAESGEGLGWPAARPGGSENRGGRSSDLAGSRGAGAGESNGDGEGRGSQENTRGAGLDGQSESPDAFVWPSAPASRQPGRPARPNLASRKPGNVLAQGQPIGSSSDEAGKGQAGSATRRPGGLATASRRWTSPGPDLGGTGTGTDDPAATGESSSGSGYPDGPRGSAPRGGTAEASSGSGTQTIQLPELEPAEPGTGSRSFEPPKPDGPVSSGTMPASEKSGGVAGARENQRGGPDKKKRSSTGLKGGGASSIGSGSAGSDTPARPPLSGPVGDPAPADPSLKPFLSPSSGSASTDAEPSDKGTDTGTGTSSKASARPPADLSSRLGLDALTSTDKKQAGSTNASSPPAGLNLGSSSGSASPPASASSASGLVFGSDANSTSGTAKGSPDFPSTPSRISDTQAKAIDVPFEIVVVCGPDDLVIHPGGYRITGQSLQVRRKDNLLVRQLLGVAQQRAIADPKIRPQPRVKFLVESGGSSTFWAARKQILFSGLSWPMSLQVTGAQDPHLLGKESW